MRKLLSLTVIAVLAFGLVPAVAEETSDDSSSTVDCGALAGRERLTAEGFALEFDAPAFTYPGLSAPVNNVLPFTTALRTAQFPFVVDLAPAATATAELMLQWTDPSDYDLYVLDDEGQRLAGSDESNIDGGTVSEHIPVLDLEHCQRVTVVARSWAGSPAQELKLTVKVTPGEELLACAENDPAPGCAGKAAGEAPDAVADARQLLYLGGTPGQVSMVHSYPNPDGPVPFRGTLSADRPTTGTPNSYTRPVFGFRDQYQNPFVPHFKGALTEPRDILGTVDAIVWLSSPTLKDGGTLFVDLYADGGLAKSVKVAGTKIRVEPTRLHVAFTDVEVEDATTVTLQLGTDPAVSSNGPGNPADAVFTTHYGSVQFPSRITLP